jgi:sugar phosphate isomerase/epimerase
VKLSVCSGNYGKNPMDWIITRVKELGYDGVEFPVVFQIPPEKTSQLERKQLRGQLKEAELELSAFHHVFPSGASLVSANAKLRREAINHTKEVIRLAQDLGCGIIVLGGGGARMRSPDVSLHQGLEWLGEAYEECGHVAEDMGITLAIEPLNRYETNTLLNFDETLQMIREVNCDAVKIMGDTFHMNIEERSLFDSFLKAGENLVHVHIADSNRLAPGRGHIDFRGIVKALKEIGYQGYLSLEVYAISPWMQYLPDARDAHREASFAKMRMEEIFRES